ncbi:MAG: AAA family ATPase [Bryobacteraceae bacterium]|nr:AAA family ATPase [Bryobacteraceae bacterium]
MFSSIRIRNYKGIEKTPQIDLRRFHVLVGPNGSGKSTFLEAIQFLKSCVLRGPAAAVKDLVPQYRDLTFQRRGGPIEFDVGLRFGTASTDQRGLLNYRLVLTFDDQAGVCIVEEVLRRGSSSRLLGKSANGNDFYRRETGVQTDRFQFGPGRLALSNTPPDSTRYPTGNRVRDFIVRGVRKIQLNSVAMREPAPATSSAELELDGTNLPRVVGNLLKNGDTTPSAGGRAAVSRWTEHLKYALDDLESIGWAAREPDNAEYLVLRFKGGLECPNWLLSDGTLRMLALTLPAFVPAEPSLYMVEEPENGVHPHAIEVIVKALAAIPEAQVFVATHSPLVVQQCGVTPLLCFARDERRGVRITRGTSHPALRDWKGTPELSSIFASRVLG